MYPNYIEEIADWLRINDLRVYLLLVVLLKPKTDLRSKIKDFKLILVLKEEMYGPAKAYLF
jgi:hypothetical protein